MANILNIVQIASGVLTIILVMIQRTSPDFGGSAGGEMSFAHTRRGAEKFLFFTTIFFALVFIASSIAVIVL